MSIIQFSRRDIPETGGPDDPGFWCYTCPDCDSDIFMIATAGDVVCAECGVCVDLIVQEPE